MPYGSVHFTADRGSYPHETPFFGAQRIPRFRTNVVAYQPISPREGTKSGAKRGWRSGAGVRRICWSHPSMHCQDRSPGHRGAWSSDLLIVKFARCWCTDAKVAWSMILASGCGLRSHSDSGIFSSFGCCFLEVLASGNQRCTRNGSHLCEPHGFVPAEVPTARRNVGINLYPGLNYCRQ